MRLPKGAGGVGGGAATMPPSWKYDDSKSVSYCSHPRLYLSSWETESTRRAMAMISFPEVARSPLSRKLSKTTTDAES